MEHARKKGSIERAIVRIDSVNVNAVGYLAQGGRRSDRERRRIDKRGAATECPHASAASGVVGPASTEKYT